MTPDVEADLHGRAFHDYLHGQFVPPFAYERSDGLKSEYDISARFHTLEQFDTRELFAVDHVHGRVLDIGCGAGKHALAFQNLGLDVVGIDASPLAVKVSQCRGVRRAQVMRAEALAFEPASFDCATFFSSGLSMGGDAEGVRQILQGLWQVLRPGGIIVMENIDVTRGLDHRDQAYVTANLAAGRPAGAIRMRCLYRGLIGGWYGWLLLPPRELEPLLVATGWRLAELAYFGNGPYCALIVKDPEPRRAQSVGPAPLPC